MTTRRRWTPARVPGTTAGRVHAVVRGARHAVWAPGSAWPPRPTYAEPFSLEIAGDAASAARKWHGLGADFPAALTLVDRRATPTAGVRALDLLDALRAEATARGVRRRLRGGRLRGDSTGARRTDTLAHPQA